MRPLPETTMARPAVRRPSWHTVMVVFENQLRPDGRNVMRLRKWELVAMLILELFE